MAQDLSIGRGKNGKPYPMAHTPPAQRDYQQAIRDAIEEGYPDLEMFPPGTTLYAFFYFWHKINQYQTQTGRNMKSKDIDTTNAVKSTEDALQGLVYKNDTNNRLSLGFMMEQGIDVEPQVMVYVTTELTYEETKEDMIYAGRDYLARLDRPAHPGNIVLSVTP